jgi:hypothetical protein
MALAKRTAGDSTDVRQRGISASKRVAIARTPLRVFSNIQKLHALIRRHLRMEPFKKTSYYPLILMHSSNAFSNFFLE